MVFFYYYSALYFQILLRYHGSMHHKHATSLRTLFLIVIVFITYATVGHMWLEHLNFLDALLRTFLIFSTLGFSEATTQTAAGKWFTILLILIGIGVIVYVSSTFVRAVIEGELTGTWRKHKVMKKLAHLKDHAIICGFGRVGRQVAEEMAAEEIPLVIIDRENYAEECEKRGYLFLHGDAAANDDTLQRAGLDHARVLIIAFGNDSENLSLAVTARALNEKIFIVGRATSHAAEERLIRVGVNRVALPAYIGGYHMATMALRPNVVDFLDVLIDSKREEMQIEELEIVSNSALVGANIHTALPNKKGAPTLLALRRKDAKSFIRPTSAVHIEIGDKLILMGTVHQLDQLMERK